MLEIKAVLPVVLLLCSAIMAFRCRIYVRAPDAMDLYIDADTGFPITKPWEIKKCD